MMASRDKSNDGIHPFRLLMMSLGFFKSPLAVLHPRILPRLAIRTAQEIVGFLIADNNSKSYAVASTAFPLPQPLPRGEGSSPSRLSSKKSLTFGEKADYRRPPDSPPLVGGAGGGGSDDRNCVTFELLRKSSSSSSSSSFSNLKNDRRRGRRRGRRRA
jgi:hypothetical protein